MIAPARLFVWVCTVFHPLFPISHTEQQCTWSTGRGRPHHDRPGGRHRPLEPRRLGTHERWQSPDHPEAAVGPFGNGRPCDRTHPQTDVSDDRGELRIPINSGRVFRREAGHRSDLKPATIPK
jgi:hypothetical protein